MKIKLDKKDIIFIIITSLLAVSCLVMGIFLVNYHQRKDTSNAFETYYNEHVSSYRVQNSNLSKGQIVFLGDSITDLYHLDDYYADLDKACYHRGIGGDTTSGVIKRLQVSLYDIEPSEIVLMIGINDLNGGKTNEEVIKNYKFILDDIKTHLPSAKVFTMSILPMDDRMEGYVHVSTQNEKVMEVNTSIQQLAIEHSYTYLDLFTLMKDENNKLISSYSDDGLHPNAWGYQVWTNLLKPLL